MPKKDENKKKRKAPKKNKDKNRPKRSMSSFMFFANNKRPDVKKEFPDMKITDMGKKLGIMWKELDADGKKKYEEMAQQDQKRYAEQMKTYVPPPADSSDSDSDSDSDNKKSKKKRKTKKEKDPNKPKRSMSSYMFYANAKRPEVKEANPGIKATDVVKKISELWKTATESDKKIFEEMASKDKERYQAAMANYKPPAEKKKKKKKESSSSSSSSDSESSETD